MGNSNSGLAEYWLGPTVANQNLMNTSTSQSIVDNMTKGYQPAAYVPGVTGVSIPETSPNFMNSNTRLPGSSNQYLANTTLTAEQFNSLPLNVQNNAIDAGVNVATTPQTSQGFDWQGAGNFVLGVGQLGLGLANYENARKYNKEAIETMKANRDLAQDQYIDRQNFKAGLAGAYN